MYDSTFEELKNKCLDSFLDKDSFELIDINIDTPIFADDCPLHLKFGGGFDIWKSRLIYILQIIENTKEGEPFIFSDVDIVFYRPLLPALNEVYDNHDILFLRELYEGIHEPQFGNINFGFNMIRSSDKTHKFFSDILKQVNETGLWEQLLINKNLYADNNYDLKWMLFPPTFFSSSVGTNRLNNEIKNVVLYHANCATTKQQKLEFMSYVDSILVSKCA
jgi:hypothetical protein